MPDVNNGAMTGADRVNNAAAIGSSRFRGRSAGLTQATQTRPMYGHDQAADTILRSAGLGRRTPDKKSPGEQMSDADQPSQEVVAGDGKMVHRKATDDGVREVPLSLLDVRDQVLGDYDNLEHNTNVPAMQRRMGVPPLF